MVKKPSPTILDFRAWLKTVPADELRQWLLDAFVRGQLSETELYKFFMLRPPSKTARSIRPRLVHPVAKS